MHNIQGAILRDTSVGGLVSGWIIDLLPLVAFPEARSPESISSSHRSWLQQLDYLTIVQEVPYGLSLIDHRGDRPA